jgi:leucine dehydrogenase
MAGLRFGGGKAVILKTDDFSGSDELYQKFGEFVELLNGSYITAEDVGMSVAIMETIARRTSYVSGLPQKEGHAGGDPSPKTAFGIFKGIEAAVRFKLHREDVHGLTVAVQGIGHVGYHVCRYLAEAGAKLLVADIDPSKAQTACDDFGATAIPFDEILFQDVDVVSPCALGAILNENSIPKLRTPIVAGAANNQLGSPADGQRLADAEILFAPDYVINAGGIINVANEYYGTADDAAVMPQIAAIGPRLMQIFEQAAATGRPTNVIADEEARRIIAAAAGGLVTTDAAPPATPPGPGDPTRASIVRRDG